MSGKAPAGAGKLVITLVRGLAGKKEVYKETCKALGLMKAWKTTEKPNNESVRGMVDKVCRGSQTQADPLLPWLLPKN